MPRRVFFSFHYEPDNWRASQVRNMGIVEGNSAVSDNDWETVTRGGDAAIQRWIDDQLRGKACTVVLIGTNTAGRKWVKYEIEKSWNDGKGVLGIHINNLQNRHQNQSHKGLNPFVDFTMERDRSQLSSIVRVYDPPYYASTDVYRYISNNIAGWVEEAIRIRNAY